MTRESFRIPGDIRIPTRFFSRFTWKDLVRIGLPTTLATALVYQNNSATLGNLPIIFAGLAIGTAWYLFTPYNRHLDLHLYHGLRWVARKRADEANDIEEKSSDYILVEDQSAVALIQVSPTNLEMKTGSEQRALHEIYREVFESVSYPLSIHTRQDKLSLTSYIDRLQEQETSRELVKEDYLEYCRNLAENNLIQTNHYIAVRVPGDNLSWIQDQLPEYLPKDPNWETDSENEALENELDSRCREVIQALQSPEITAERITGSELHKLADQFQSIVRLDPTPKWTSQPYSNTLGEYRRTIYISELPSNLDLGWPLELMRTGGQIDITQVVRPRQSGSTSKKLQRLSEKLNAEIDSLLRHGYRGTNKLEGLLDDVEWFLNLLADRADQPVEYGFYITVHNQSQEQSLQSFEQVCNRLDTLQIDYQEPILRTDQALYTDNPLHSDQLVETLLMPAGSAAAGFPFATQDLARTSGVIYGVNKSDNTPILLDRFQWSSHSMARMGMVGSGKSYAAKIEVMRAALAYGDLEIIIVDPKKEYDRVIRNLGGKIHELDQETEFSFKDDVTGYTVKERGKTEDVDLLTEAVEQIYRYVSQNQRKTLVILDEARILLNDEHGRTVLNRFVLEARDTNTAITLITQNASHFTHSREGREILDNMPGKIFMRHDRVPDSVVDYFDLSQREKQALYELKTGTDSEFSEALLRVSGKLNTRLQIESTPQENAVITTGEDQS